MKFNGFFGKAIATAFSMIERSQYKSDSPQYLHLIKLHKSYLIRQAKYQINAFELPSSRFASIINFVEHPKVTQQLSENIILTTVDDLYN